MLLNLSKFYFIVIICCQHVFSRKPTKHDISVAFSIALKNVAEEHKDKNYTDYYFNTKYDGRKGAYAAYLQKFGHYLEYEKSQKVLEEATRILKKSLKLSNPEVFELKEIDLSNIFPDIKEKCHDVREDIHCDRDYPYRTMDGSCNNVMHPTWGKSFTCFNRMFYPVYSDGVSALRKSVYGSELPDPRTISLTITSDENKPSKTGTIFHMMFGQFLTHDVSLSVNPAGRPLGPQIDCCSQTENKPIECMPINISNHDPFYGKYGVKCLSTARTHMCPTCKLGFREHTNQLTSYIDGSMIYGMTNEMSDQLRSFDGTGTLKHLNDNDVGELLSESTIPDADHCSFQKKGRKCFQGGDVALNQHILLTIFHTIFMRQHNRIARKLHLMNEYWNDEKIFQETRKILVAQIQMITYNEHLPKIIGKHAMEYYRLTVNERPIYTKYNPKINPSITTEFSASAYRIGHSQIMKLIPIVLPHNVEHIWYHDTYNWPYYLYEQTYIEVLTKGMALGPCQEADRYVVTEITNHGLQLRGNVTGTDISAIDMFRGRDQGMPPYTEMVKLCLGIDIRSFEDLIPLLGEDNVKYFKTVYRHVRDIDFLSAAFAEKHVVGGDAGPTLSYIISTQFNNLKFGDRFYFEHENQVGSFTPEQLQEIKKTRLSKIICDNIDIDEIQEYVMLLPRNENPIIHCKDLPEMDLTVFI